MTKQITIGSSLTSEEITSETLFTHKCVIDLRHTENGKAQAIDETLLKRMQNFHIDYHQMPIDLKRSNSIQDDILHEKIEAESQDTLVLTDDAATLAHFCMRRNIRFGSRQIFVVDTGARLEQAKSYDQQDVQSCGTGSTG